MCAASAPEVPDVSLKAEPLCQDAQHPSMPRRSAGVQISVGFAMSLGARVPQIVLNYRRGNSGELSLITCALSSLGNLARCFTTVILTADWVLFASTFAQFVLNGILTWQCVDTERQNRAAASAADGETKAA